MFNKQLLAQNIKYLAVIKGKKLGELEAEAHVSPGYLSRMFKSEDCSGSPLMDLLMYASEIFSISADSLLNVNLQSLSPNEQFLNTFFEKLLKDSCNGTLVWTLETKNALQFYSREYPHPLINCINDCNCAQFYSLFNPNNMLGEASAHASIGENLIYIIQIECNSFDSYNSAGFEVYFTNKNKECLQKIVCIMRSDALFSIVNNIFAEALKPKNQIDICDNVRNIIDSFINSDDNLPF